MGWMAEEPGERLARQDTDGVHGGCIDVRKRSNWRGEEGTQRRPRWDGVNARMLRLRMVSLRPAAMM